VIDIGIKGPRYVPGVSPFGTTDQYYMFTEPASWKKPQTPLLHTKGKCGADGVPFIDVPENATTVELIINNLTPTAHILHLHGMAFSVINYAPYSETWCALNEFWCMSEPDPFAKAVLCDNARRGDPNTTYPLDSFWGCPYDETKHKGSQNLEAPLVKDLVPVWRRSWVVLRFKADNPGTWMFHCHSEHHLVLGQMMAFNIKPAEQPPLPVDIPTEGPCRVWSKTQPRPPKRSYDMFV
jgi:FtsP/CotA-like multicopper oxidase with cupredoxin domain